MMGPRSSVCMVYGLVPEKINCKRLFNIFCQYGNIVRIMFMKTKEGCAMVELADPDSCERAIANLNHTPMFGSKMRLDFSKHPYIEDIRAPHTLPDDSTSFMDFSKHPYIEDIRAPHTLPE